MNLPDREDFNFKDCVIARDECWLITPKDMSTKWTDEIARFRSCIVRKSDNFVVSQGFGKFTNFGERPDFQPWDSSWKFEARHKLDGSLLIVSKYKNELICRTRGTTDARQLDNGHEIDLLIKKYNLLRLFNINIEKNGEYSFLFEWTTPNNVIVLREHNEPTLTLLGIVDNATGRYSPQEFVDIHADYLEISRPQKYEYNSVEECILDVDAWEGKEGVVLYSPDGQTLKKIKASLYCELHKLATGIKTIKQVMELFLASPKFTSGDEFYRYVETALDYEIAEKIKPEIETVVQAYCTYKDKLNRLVDVVNDLSYCDSRKEQALVITTRYDDWRTGHAFLMLDNREITDKILSNAVFQELEDLTNKNKYETNTSNL
jgi:hypothetical protein